MTDRPILFSAPMIKALLAGTKTQTRRVLKDQPGDLDKPFMMDDGSWHVTDSHGGHMSPLMVRFRKGDRLWVKETWLPDPSRDDDAWDGWECSPVEFDGCGLKPSMVPPALRHSGNAIFAADPKWTIHGLRWKPSIHMPRWASRLTLTVTDVRVQRLNECTEGDALAEGVVQARDGCFVVPGVDHPNKDFGELSRVTAREMYAALWDVINGSGSWLASPWIVALTFTVERRNIDAARAA